MKVRMKVEVSGTRNGADWPKPGGTLDVPDDEGAALCAAGMAEPVRSERKVEKATAPAAEKRETERPLVPGPEPRP